MMKQNKIGYLSYDLKSTIAYKEIEFLNQCRKKCTKMIVGIPADDFILRMSNHQPEVTFQKKKEMLLSLKAVDEVIEIDINNIIKQKSYEQFHYDICFYGVEYGRRYQEDRQFFERQGVEMVSLLPDTLSGKAAFQEALDNAASGKKVILFGTGAYFDYYISNYAAEYPPVYAVDNSPEKWNTEKNGVMIKAPDVLAVEDPESVFIVLCCKNYEAVLTQLLSIRNFNYRPMRGFDQAGILDEYAVTWQDEQEYVHKAQGILLKLMTEFDNACRKYGLKYYINAGSLIGVVRHHGFIPWDDDLDVAMPREDYDILRSKAGEIWKDSDFMLVGYDQLGESVFSDFIPRLLYMKEDMPNGIYNKVAGKARPEIFNKTGLDIFILEKASNKKWKHSLATNTIKGIYALAMAHRAFIDYTEYDQVSIIMRFLIRIANIMGKMIPLSLLFRLFEKASAYAAKEECDYYFESNGPIPNYMPLTFKQSFFGEGKEADMCGMQVRIPEDYDGLLHIKYAGDYMQLPSLNQRRPGHTVKRKGVIW